MDELINVNFGDRYFSADDGLAESSHVFVRGNRMVERFRLEDSLRVAETGFGTGLNLLASLLALGTACQDSLDRRVRGRLDWTSVECFPLARPVMDRVLAGFPVIDDLRMALVEAYPDGDLMPGSWNNFGFSSGGLEVTVHLWYGDVLEMLAALAASPPTDWPDCWVLDGHSPSVNPGMWSLAVFEGMARCSRLEPASSFASYTAAGTVKSGLRQAGFTVRRQAGYGRKRHMISGEYAGLSPEKNA